MSNKIEDYKKYASGASSGGTSNISNDSTDYYQMSKNQEYATLLDKEIELENARSAALKHTNNQLAAQGMASQGYGSSQMAGITGRYLNAYESANRDYQNNVNNLNYQQNQEQVANANDRFESITTMMSQASNMDQLHSLLTDYQYGSIDDEGNFTFNEKPEGMSDDDWYQMKYYYNLQKGAIEQMEEANKVEEYVATYGSESAWRTSSFRTSDGKTKSVDERFNQESKAIWANINAGQYTYGTSIKLQNKWDEVIYVQWTQNGLRMIDKDTYNSSEKKDELVYGVNVNK